MMRITACVAAALAGALSLAGEARADAIYGHWCYGDEHMEVGFDALITPGGHTPEAYIDRHTAQYVAPEDERDAGSGVALRVLNDEQMARYLVDAASGRLSPDREIWTRCSAPERTS